MEQQTSQPGYAQGGAPGSRPGQVTAAAVILFVIGGLGVLGGLLTLLGAGLFPADLALLFTIFGIVIAVVAGAQIYAGVRVLGLQAAGRTFAIAVCVVAAVVQVLYVVLTGTGLVGAIIGIAVNGLVIFFLQQNQGAFTR
jgi:hypothetical protein